MAIEQAAGIRARPSGLAGRLGMGQILAKAHRVYDASPPRRAPGQPILPGEGRQRAQEAANSMAWRDRPPDWTPSARDASRPGVQVGDHDSYKDLNRQSQGYDGMEHDHMPSSAAIIERAKRGTNDSLTAAEKARLRDNAQALVLPADWHRYMSRTYGQSAAQASADADDLRRAFEADLAAYYDALRRHGWQDADIDDIFRSFIDANRHLYR